MAKFGLFDGRSQEPYQEYEGEYLEVNGDVVCVVANDGSGHERAIATIRLTEGQSVKKIK